MINAVVANPERIETDYLVVGAGAVGMAQAWLDQSRLNVLRELPETADPEKLLDRQGRFLTSVFPAPAKLEELAAAVTPAERERWFESV